MKPGDLLLIPFQQDELSKSVVLYSAVLRLGKVGEIYISFPNESEAISKPCHYNNPIHWDGDKEAFIDSSGDELVWSSTDIQVLRGDAIAVAEEYEKVPRVDDVRCVVTEEVAEAFLHSLDSTIIDAIMQNEEAGNVSQQLSLIMDHIGLKDHNASQLAVIEYFIVMILEGINSQKARIMLNIMFTQDELPNESDDALKNGSQIH
ncbi:MAG: hypothetical protein AAB614_02545 [Patescibacteria group bacterium]